MAEQAGVINMEPLDPATLTDGSASRLEAGN